MSLIDLLGRGFGLVYAEGPNLPTITKAVNPETTALNGCTDPRQQGSYIVPASFGASLDWTIKDAAGNPIITAEEPSDGQDISEEWDRIALFHDPFCSKSMYLGRLNVSEDGHLIVYLPPYVQDSPGIYEAEVHWREDGTPDQHYYSNALVSVEDSIYNRAMTGSQRGPLPLSRVRQKLRDYGGLNDTLGQPEFSVEEILSAMLEPIEYYNEMPPHVAGFSPQNFPYRQQWLDATVSRLLLTSGLWLTRNNIEIKSEGVRSNDRAQGPAMLQLADRMWQSYREFVHNDKTRINITRGFGII
jgi:hypothetical protein